MRTTRWTGTTTCRGRDRANRLYNPRNTDDPLDIKYRIEDRIEKHSEDVQVKRSVLDETYNRRTQAERTNDAVKDCGLGPVHAPGGVHARTQVFVALCFRVVVTITNDERGDNPGREMLTSEMDSMTRSLVSKPRPPHARWNQRPVRIQHGRQTMPLAVLAEFVTDQNVGSVLFGELVENFSVI